jgi:RNA polymerase sigma-70 factor (ECF subfamily)
MELNVRQDRRQEFQDVAMPHAHALYHFALHMTHNESTAEDLVQDTYLRAYRFFDHFEPGTNIRAWLFRILRNIFINEYRRLKREPGRVEWSQVEGAGEKALISAHGGPRTPEADLVDSSIDPLIRKALADLPSEYRAVVLLNFAADLSYKEIAATLDIPMGTVMSRIHRGRRILQRRLAEHPRFRQRAQAPAPPPAPLLPLRPRQNGT